MTPSRYRDQVAQLAKTNPDRGIEIAKEITEPWFQAQAWSHLARYADKPLPFAHKAAEAAAKTKDDYQRSAVRAWEIAALGERKNLVQARRSLADALELASSVEPISSRAEALLLLFAAAFKISKEDAAIAAQVIVKSCASSHWRAVRACKYANLMLAGKMLPREFFW